VVRKLKLTSGTSYDYTTIGIACHMKDYRFTFFLNDHLGFQMKRMEDLFYGNGKDSLGYSFYFYRNPEERKNFYLVSNYHEEGYLPKKELISFLLSMIFYRQAGKSN
jgi:hypothetical protein